MQAMRVKKNSRGRPRRDRRVVVLFLLLAAIGAALWFADPNHWPAGPSRIPWPEAVPAKP